MHFQEGMGEKRKDGVEKEEILSHDIIAPLEWISMSSSRSYIMVLQHLTSVWWSKKWFDYIKQDVNLRAILGDLTLKQ